MYKIIVVLVGFMSFFSSVQGQLLWKISGNGLKKSSYLFGTHHFIPLQFLDSIPGLYQAFNTSEIVVGEMVVNNLDAVEKVKKAAIIPNQQTIYDLVDKNQILQIDSALKSVLHIGLKEMALLQPNLILTIYQTEVYKKASGQIENIAPDSYFQQLGIAKGKKIVGLETIDQQLEILFDKTSLQRQTEIFTYSVLHTDNMILETNKLNNFYKKGDLEKLLLLSIQKNNPSDATAEEYYKLVDERNLEWMKQLPDLIKTSSCFITVGALHLPGENGLIEQFRKLGYHVTEVKKLGNNYIYYLKLLHNQLSKGKSSR